MAGIIDAHLHLDFHGRDKEQAAEQLKRLLEEKGIDRGVLYLIGDEDFEEGIYSLDFGQSVTPAVMLDPRRPDVEQCLLKLKQQGIKIMKLLPYEQRLLYEDFEQVCRYAMKVQECGMVLTVCGSYGSRDIYHTNGVAMAAEILRTGFQRPLVIAHGGMVRTLDAYALMCEYKNVYIDISFTIPEWWGSHIMDDLYFVMEKFGFERIFWGSDYPYHSYEDELAYFDMFCDKYQISTHNRQKLLNDNFEQFYGEYFV